MQTFHPSFSKLYISETIDISRSLFQFESAKKQFGTQKQTATAQKYHQTNSNKHS